MKSTANITPCRRVLNAFALLLMVAMASALSGCCALAPCHPATALIGTVVSENGASVEAARITLYGKNVRSNARGCFKARFPDALPFTFTATAEGYKSIEVKARPGTYRAKISLASTESSEASRIEWSAISTLEYEDSSCS